MSKNEEPQKASRAKILLAGAIPCQGILVREKEAYGEETLSYDSCFSGMKTLMDEVDLTIGALSTEYTYPDDFMEALKKAGFDVLTVGTGADEEAGRDIFRSIEKHGMAHPEGGKVGSSIHDVNGIRIGIVDCTFNNAYRDLSILSEVKDKAELLDAEQVDAKICYVHWKYFTDLELDLDETQRVIAKALANIGFDYITGSGTAFLMRFEIMKGSWNRRTPVAYSLGNLIYCSGQSNRCTSAVIQLSIRKDADGRVTFYDSYLPCYTWTVLAGKRRRVQFLNDRVYLEESKKQVEGRKAFAANRLGYGIPLCHDYDVAKKKSAEKPEAPEWQAGVYERDRLNAVDEAQKIILDSYRISDEFRERYGELLYSSEANSPLISGAERFLSMHRPEFLEREDAADIVADMIYSRFILDFSYTEYLEFHFFEKSIKERIGYISDRYRLNYYRRIHTDEEARRVLDNKWEFYEKMKDLFKREVVSIENSSQREKFVEFADKYDRFIIKPVKGSLGKGIRILDRKDYGDAEELFDRIYAKAGPFICEEVIEQRDYISAVHPESVNTVRLFTYNDNGDIKLICAYLRAGTGDAIVDNGGSGGVFAAINPKTGVVKHDASNEIGDAFEYHPDTGVQFVGLKIEDWDELMAMTEEASRRFPTIKIIAWDMAHGKKGWQIVEGNAQGQMWVYQGSTGIGMRKRMERVIGWQSSKRKKK